MARISVILVAIVLFWALAAMGQTPAAALSCGHAGKVERWLLQDHGCWIAKPGAARESWALWGGYAEEKPHPELWYGVPVQRCLGKRGEVRARVTTGDDGLTCLIWLRTTIGNPFF